MLRVGLNSLKFLNSTDCFSPSKIRLVTAQCFLFNANVQARFLHATQTQLKKQGQFIDTAARDEEVKKTDTPAASSQFKVKLYPGFQQSAEEQTQQDEQSNEISGLFSEKIF